MKERIIKAAKRYLALLGYDDLDQIVNGFLAYKDENDLVFINVCWSSQQFAESDHDTLKHDFELALEEWFSDPKNIDRADYVVRCDEVSFWVCSESRALVRHTRNALSK